MKRGTPGHPKMRDLARKLDIPIYSAVGLLEMLWHYTGTYAPRGDIGRFPDEEIADALGWPPKKSPVLIEALVSSRWLDRDEEYRLAVHDWAEHAEESVRKKLARVGDTFLPLSRQCLDTDGNVAASRGALAKAKALASEKKGGPGGNKIAANGKLEDLTVSDEPEKLQILGGLRELWDKAGLAFNHGDEFMGSTIFLSRPLDKCNKIRDFAVWAFANNYWPSPQKTKRFRRFIEDGDGENGVPNRTLQVPPERKLTKVDQAHQAAARRFAEGRK